MPTLLWSDALAMDLPAMDQTHREFIDLLGAVEAAADADVMPTWRALVDHTDDHFAREDQWMLDTHFAASNCHIVQHKTVMKVLREVLSVTENGQMEPVRQLSRELASWFPQHAQSMDAALAQHLRKVGYDTATGAIGKPQALPSALIHGCGGASCSEPVHQNSATDAPAAA